MKKLIIVSSLIAALAINTTAVQADPSTEENVGFVSGAITGAAVGGPIGFFIGAIAGVLVGEQVEKASHLDEVTAELNQSKFDRQALEIEVTELHKSLNQNPSLSSAKVDWLTQGLTLNMMFTTNSTDLSDTDRSMIQRLSKVLAEYPELQVKLDGYADPRGSEQDNLQLSLKRTQAVESAFESLGIDSSRLTIQAHGEAQAKIGSNDGYAMDRRVSMNFFTKTHDVVAQN